MADQAFRAASALQKLGLVADALSRLYFGVFHLARAVLAAEGIEVKSHRGVQSLLGLHFFKPRRLALDHQRTLARLETWRDRADYDAGFVADAALLRAEMAAARKLRRAFESFLRPYLNALPARVGKD